MSDPSADNWRQINRKNRKICHSESAFFADEESTTTLFSVVRDSSSAKQRRIQNDISFKALLLMAGLIIEGKVKIHKAGVIKKSTKLFLYVVF